MKTTIRHLTQYEEKIIRSTLDHYLVQAHPRAVTAEGIPVFRDGHGNCCGVGRLLDWDNIPEGELKAALHNPNSWVHQFLPVVDIPRNWFLPEWQSMPIHCLYLAQAIHDFLLKEYPVKVPDDFYFLFEGRENPTKKQIWKAKAKTVEFLLILAEYLGPQGRIEGPQGHTVLS